MIQAPAKGHLNQALTKSHFKLNRRGLTELVLACAFLALFTFALWSWQINGGHVTAMDSAAPEVELSLMPLILRHPAIMLSTVVAEFILLLALVLAIVPLSWWLRTDYLIAGESTRAITPLRWVIEKLRFVRPPTQAAEGEVPGEFVMDEEGKLVFVPQTGVDGEVEADKDVVMVEQADGTVLAMIQQSDGTLVPAETKPKEGDAAEATDPLLPQPGPANDALTFEEEEEDPLTDLADIGDILNSAFDDDSAVDPEREAISRSLEEVDVMAVLRNAAQRLGNFQAVGEINREMHVVG